MPLDPAAVLTRIFSGGVFTPATGTFTQGDTDYDLSKVHFHSRQRAYGAGERDEEEAQAVFLATDLSDAGLDDPPQRDARFVLTGETRAWVVTEINAIAPPSGTPAGWTLQLRRDTSRTTTE